MQIVNTLVMKKWLVIMMMACPVMGGAQVRVESVP